MFTKRQIDSSLDQEILAVIADLESLRDDPEKYDAALERLSKLEKLQTRKGLQPPSMDTVLLVSANLIGVFWLTTYERERPITSRVMNFVMKLK
jgi:hypothetical protein